MNVFNKSTLHKKLPIFISLLMGFSGIGLAQDTKTFEQNAKELVRYDYCGSRPWQSCGDRKIGRGYTVCENYLKYLNQSLPKINVCSIPIPPKFKTPEWEILDVKSNLRLAYDAEDLRFSDRSWYKKPEFETWKNQLLQEIADGKTVPILKKTRITPTTKGPVTILSYTRDSTGCDKRIKGIFPEDNSILNHWMDSGYIYFVLTAKGKLLPIGGGFGSVSELLTYELLLYAGKPYFAMTFAETLYPRSRHIVALYPSLTMHNPDPDYLYTQHFCQFETVSKRSPFTGK